MNERISWIDSVKGVAMLLVIAIHLCGLSSPIIYLCYGFMAVFYIVSGYTYASRTPISNQIAKKTKRFFIPCLFYGILGIFIYVLCHDGTDYIRALFGLIYGRWALYPVDHEGENVLFLGECNPVTPLWFLYSLYISYLIFYAYKKFSNYRLVFILLLSLLALASVYKPILFPWSFDTAPLTALFIIFGDFLSTTHLFATADKNRKLLFLSLIVLGLLYYVLCKINLMPNLALGIYGKYGLYSVFLYFIIGVLDAIILSLSCLIVDKTFIGKFLSYTGRHSLRLMCIHWIIGDAVILCLNDSVSKYVALFISLVIIYLIDALVSKLCSLWKNDFSLMKYI